MAGISMDPVDTPAPQLPAITNGELGEPITENEGTKAEAADSEAELRFRLTEKQKEPVVCYDCRTNQDPSNCQKQGKPNNPKNRCNACNRRNTKFSQVLRQCPKMATMWGDMNKEKKEIKDALSADDEGDMKEAMLKNRHDESHELQGHQEPRGETAPPQHLGNHGVQHRRIGEHQEAWWGAETT